MLHSRQNWNLFHLSSISAILARIWKKANNSVQKYWAHDPMEVFLYYKIHNIEKEIKEIKNYYWKLNTKMAVSCRQAPSTYSVWAGAHRAFKDTILSSCDLRSFAMISLDLVAKECFALLCLEPDTVDSRLLTTRHPPDSHRFEPGRVTWKWQQNLTFWPLIPGGPGKPMGPGSPCTIKTSRITIFHWNLMQGYKHMELHIFSAIMDIRYEVTNVVLSGIDYFYFFF